MMEYETPTRYDPKPFIQYAADNVDYNIRTLDGRNSFHGMGMIASFTPRTKTDALIKRLNVTSDDLASVGQINIQSVAPFVEILSTMQYEHLFDPKKEYPNANLDLLWKISPMLKVDMPPYSGIWFTMVSIQRLPQ